MTGESLFNGSIDNVTREVAQGTAKGIDFSLNSNIREALAAIVAVIIIILLIRHVSRKK